MTPETFAGSQFFKGPTSFGFLVLLICLISANVCISTSPTRKPGSGAIVSASSSANSLSLPVFGPNVGEMSIADRDNLHKMVKNVLKFYEHSMRPLDQAKSRISWGAIKNTVALGVNFCQAAISMTSGLKVAPRFPVEDEFFEMLAGVGRAISNRANELVGSKSYSKTNVDRLVLKQRAQTMLDNIHKIVGDSVYGLYLQWDKLASMEDPNEAGKRLDMLEELADIIAQLRAVDIVHDMNTIRGIFNELRKDNARALAKQASSGASSAGSSVVASEGSEHDHITKCQDATD